MQNRESEFELKLRIRDYEVEELQSQKHQLEDEMTQTTHKAEKTVKQQLSDL